MAEEVKKVTDHIGTEYDTTQEMCAVWGVNYEDYLRLRQKGFTKREALTNEDIKTNENKSIPDAKPCEDHKGNKFDSINAKCKFYNIKISTYYSRLSSGMSEEEALTTPVTNTLKPKDIVYEDECDEKFLTTYKDFVKERNKVFELEHKTQLLDKKISRAIKEKKNTQKELAEYKKTSGFSKMLNYFNHKQKSGFITETPTAKNGYSIIMKKKADVKISVDDIIGILTPEQIEELQRKISR